jgi:ornithine lipid ester-linked acyl 2-hydroxylase
MKPWYSFFDRSDYRGPEPGFYETGNLPWAKHIEENYPVIKKELEELLQSDSAMKAYFNSSIVDKKLSWKTFSLSWWNVQLPSNQKKCPQTTQIISRIPNLVSASFNLLEPGANILPHCGDTNAIYRCHLGLSIPGVLPECGFKVKEESRSWEEGKLLVFCDANKHTAWNLTNKPRFIFLFDVIMDKYADQKNMICANVLGSLFLQKRAQYLPLLANTPMKLQFGIHFIIKSLILFYVPVRNAFTRIFN